MAIFFCLKESIISQFPIIFGGPPAVRNFGGGITGFPKKFAAKVDCNYFSLPDWLSLPVALVPRTHDLNLLKHRVRVL